MKMRESWRWFGPNDPVTIADIRQTGATDIVSALHNIPTGQAWPLAAIQAHQALIEDCAADLSPLTWSVVESIPVHEDIKLGRPGHQQYIDSWIASMENLAQCGIKTICYNFMPVIDWTRTDLNYKLPNGAYALRFDQSKFAAFDLFILQRDNAQAEYSVEEIVEAQAVFDPMDEAERTQLTNNIIAGLRKNLFAFLAQVLPRAEALGVKLAIHPDDPPRDMLGLPRIICTAADLDILFAALPSPANGITLCVGTYSSRPDNNLPEMAKQFGPRIHFSHLRGVSRDPQEQRSFYEASHLDSDIDMVQVVHELLLEEQRRRNDVSISANDNHGSEAYGIDEIFIRPDHGHQMMDDIGKTVNPGYSGIGRMKGLAEVRGVIRALSAQISAVSVTNKGNQA
jgi:mannonate dehydratase